LKEPFVRMKRKETMTQQTIAKRIRKVKDVSNEENKSEATNVNNEICDFGKPTFRCKHCDTLLWYEERLDSNKQMRNPKFGMCCKIGKISLPATKQPPVYLEKHLNGDDKISKKFRENIRSYNSMFAFTSTRGIVEKGINNDHAPYVF
jgi:hypothetical protein